MVSTSLLSCSGTGDSQTSSELATQADDAETPDDTNNVDEVNAAEREPTDSAPGEAGRPAVPQLAGWIQLQSDQTSSADCNLDMATSTWPESNIEAARLSKFSTPIDLESAPKVSHGDDDTQVDCVLRDYASGVEFSLNLRDQARQLELSGITPDEMGVLRYRSVETAGEFLVSSACTVDAFQADVQTGSGLFDFRCSGAQNPTTPGRVCQAVGAVYIQNCAN